MTSPPKLHCHLSVTSNSPCVLTRCFKLQHSLMGCALRPEESNVPKNCNATFCIFDGGSTGQQGQHVEKSKDACPSAALSPASVLSLTSHKLKLRSGCQQVPVLSFSLFWEFFAAEGNVVTWTDQNISFPNTSWQDFLAHRELLVLSQRVSNLSVNFSFRPSSCRYGEVR